MFHVNNIVFLLLYVLQCAHHQKSVSIHHYTVDHPPLPPFWEPLSGLWTYVTVFVWFDLFTWLVGFLSFTWVKSYGIYSFSVWLISLSIIPSRSIHIVANGKISSFYTWWYSSLYIHTMSSLASQVDLVIKNLAANVGDAGDTVLIRKIPWRRKGQPTPVFLSGKSYGQRSLVGYSPGGSQRVGHDWVTEHTHEHTCLLQLFIP